MFVKKLNWLFFIFFLSFLQAQNQEKTLQVNVSIDKKLQKFEPILPEINLLDTQQISQNQSINFEPISFSPTLQKDTIEAIKLGKNKEKENLHRLFLKAALGVVGIAPWTEIYYNSLQNEKFQYGFSYQFWWNPIWFPSEKLGKLDDYLSRSFLSNQGSIWFKFFQNNWKISTRILYDRKDFHYYGFDNEAFLLTNRKEIANFWQKTGAFLQFQTYYPETQKLNWTWKFQYHFFNSKSMNYENYLKVTGKVDWWLKKMLIRIESQVDFNITRYQRWYVNDQYDVLLDQKIANIQNSSAIFDIHPYLHFENENLEAKAGFLLGGDFILKQFLAYPDLELRFFLANKKFIPVLGLTGNYQRNSLAVLSEKNTFIHPVQEIRSTLIPLHAYLGFLTSFGNGFGLKVFGNLQIITNGYFFLPDPIKGISFEASYAHGAFNKYFFGGEFSYQYKQKLRLSLDGYYYLFTYKKSDIPTLLQDKTALWYYPNFDAHFSLHWLIHKKWTFWTKTFFIGVRDAIAVESYDQNTKNLAVFGYKKLPFYFDINLGTEYFINKKFTFFGQINNIAYQLYENYAGYPNQGIQIYLGITYKFF